MPEPKKIIEELLEASAQTRRAQFGADPKMPNPMRARLQDEIARQGEPQRRSSWITFGWSRLALGTAFASLIAATAFIWWQTQQNPTMGSRVAIEQTAAARESNQPEGLDNLGSKTGQQPPAEAAKSEVAPRAAALAGMDEKNGGARDGRSTLELAKPAPADDRNSWSFKSSTSHSVVAAGSMKQRPENANLTQQFSQTAANKVMSDNARLQQAPKILDNFKVEQNGGDFRVVDEDGSTYTGRIEQLQPNDKRSFLWGKQSYAEAPPASGPRQMDAITKTPENQFYFRVSGYNTGLKKPLVFEGNYIVTAAPARKDVDHAAKKTDEPTAARIVGQAKIPGEPPVSIEAVTAPAK